MEHQTVVITGATGSIGAAAARKFAASGAQVIMISRNRSKGEQSRDAIRAETGNNSIEFMSADLSSQQSIRELAAALAAQFPVIHVLVNNAGVFKGTRILTADGLETMFAVNHLGYFLLTYLLLEPLKAGSGRVLNITAPSTVKLNFDDLQGSERFQALNAFGASKTANLLFTMELAKRLDGTGVTVNAVHPGLVRSELMRDANPLIRWLSWISSKSPEQAAASIFALATQPEYNGKTGLFYRDGREITPPPYTHDPDVQKRLWDVSIQLTQS